MQQPIIFEVNSLSGYFSLIIVLNYDLSDLRRGYDFKCMQSKYSFNQANHSSDKQKHLTSPARAEPVRCNSVYGSIRAADTPKPRANGRGMDYPGSNMKLLWDHVNMRVTNLEEVNQFVKRTYREGWKLGDV
jgi:hypothetical protein